MLAREIANHMVIFPNRTRAVARHKAGGDMHQRRPLHSLGEGDHVLRADYVRAQRRLQSGIESDVACRVDDDVDVFGDSLSLFFAEPEIGFGDVAADNRDFVADEIFKGSAVAFTHRIERLSRNDVLPKPRLRFFLRTGAHRHIDAADIRKAMQQQAERHFADKAGAADEK